MWAEFRDQCNKLKPSFITKWLHFFNIKAKKYILMLQKKTPVSGIVLVTQKPWFDTSRFFGGYNQIGSDFSYSKLKYKKERK